MGKVNERNNRKGLERFGDQTNLGSKAARERISSEIEAVLTGGTSEEENDWICEHCGKDTSTVEYDYIGNGTNHLQCDLSYACEARNVVHNILLYIHGIKTKQNILQMDFMRVDGKRMLMYYPNK